MNQLTPRKPSGAPIGNKNAQRLGPTVKRAIDTYFANPGISVVEACERAQCPRRTWYKAIKRDAAQAYIHGIIEHRRKTLGVIDADHVINHLMRNGQSEYVRLQAAMDIQAQAGVRRRLDGAQAPAASGDIHFTFITVAAQNAQIGAPVGRHESALDAQDMVTIEHESVQIARDDAK